MSSRATFLCPVCGHRTSSTAIERHLAKLHPELSREELLGSLEASLREGVARLEVSGQRFKGVTGTKLLAEARKSGRRVRHVVHAGSPGLKKSRS